MSDKSRQGQRLDDFSYFRQLLTRLSSLPSKPGRPAWQYALLAGFSLFALVRLIVLFRHYYFFSDDFLNFVIARDMGLNASYLGRDVFGQFIPLFRFAVAAYFKIAGVRFWLYEAFAIMSTATIGALVIAQVYKRSVNWVIALPLLCLTILSPVFVDPYQWFSAGLSIFPACVLGAAALIVSAQHGERWSAMRRIGSCLLYALGLLFYPKMLFLYVLILVTRWHDRLGSKTPTTIARSLGWSAIDTIPLLAVGAAYTIYVLSHKLGSGVQQPTVGELVEYIWSGWRHGFLEGVLGLDRPWSASQPVTLLAAGLAAAMLAIWRPRSIVLLAGFLAYFVLCIGTIGINRRIPFGLENATTRHYYCDILVYSVLLLLTAFSGTQTQAIFHRYRNVLRPASLTLTVLLSIHLVRAGNRVPATWWASAEQIESFIGNVRTSFGHATQRDVIEDARVPAYIMPDWMYPYATYHGLALLFPGRYRFSSGADINAALSPDGRLVQQTPSNPP